VLSAGELQRMKEITMKEEERVARAKAELEATKGAAQRKADARKQKMLELEAQRKLAVPPSEIEQMQAKEKATMLSAADRQMAEELVRDRALFPLPSSHFPIPPCCRFVLHCLSSLFPCSPL